ncbi:MAG: hypothetical protein CYG60_15665 [Actinobacteria bacterium]|nr:MAG: hypothetical protein CYG60_15665 [Actinomycetota bacterium]
MVYVYDMTNTVGISHEVALHDALSALADPTCLRILRELRERHEHCSHLDDYLGIHVSDLAEAVGVSQPAVSKHLKLLRSVGLVRAEKRGQRSYYTRDERAIEALRLPSRPHHDRRGLPHGAPLGGVVRPEALPRQDGEEERAAGGVGQEGQVPGGAAQRDRQGGALGVDGRTAGRRAVPVPFP